MEADPQVCLQTPAIRLRCAAPRATCVVHYVKSMGFHGRNRAYWYRLACVLRKSTCTLKFGKTSACVNMCLPIPLSLIPSPTTMPTVQRWVSFGRAWKGYPKYADGDTRNRCRRRQCTDGSYIQGAKDIGPGEKSGHMVLVPNVLPATAAEGCFETYTSATGLIGAGSNGARPNLRFLRSDTRKQSSMQKWSAMPATHWTARFLRIL